MKKTGAAKKRSRVSEELRPEYHFDYAKAKSNRFAARALKGPLVVVLDEDIARVFKTPESVKAVSPFNESTRSFAANEGSHRGRPGCSRRRSERPRSSG